MKKRITKRKVSVYKTPIKKEYIKPSCYAIKGVDKMTEKQLIGCLCDKINGIMGKAFIAKEAAKTKKEKGYQHKIILECKRKLRNLSK